MDLIYSSSARVYCKSVNRTNITGWLLCILAENARQKLMIWIDTVSAAVPILESL